ncbi:P-type ATPase (P-ATPase) Superfamily [Mucor ambiguus]|uniref:P-type ATPase (P-ATPase) Superfamily n=1 Tax=Mucor ambiguus TaxID=91626 RepID=A0A0C9LYV8_9FUNG|nr:P-type ATPase (P-ATPase) Superfamily [Mucor ambiguus]
MRVASILVTLSALLIGTETLPIFEIANDHDSHELCPSALAPSCPSGQEFCLDGTCHTSCDSASISNVCLCNDPSSAPANLVPCAATQVINITHYNPRQKELQIRNICAANANIPNASSTIGIWGFPNGSTSDLVWAECPTAPPAEFTFREPMWVAVWTVAALEAFILFSWTLYKSAKEMRFNKEHPSAKESTASSLSSDSAIINEKIAASTGLDANGNIQSMEKQLASTAITATTEDIVTDNNKGTTSESTSETASLNDSERLIFRGFKRDYFGLLGFASIIITTLLFMVFLGCLVGDYYGKLHGGVLHVFLSSDASSKIFCAVWHIAAAWFATIMLFRSRIQNYFRIESHLHTCPFVQVERQQDETVFLEDDNKWISQIREIEQRVTKRFGINIVVETCPVHLTSNGLRYFEYQCMRYVYNSLKRKFEPYKFNLGTTNAQLRSWSGGNSTKEAVYRQELLGSNIIPVYVPSIPWAIVQEFSSFLYLYQLMCMWVWYYFQYYPMGLVQTSIILISAFIRIFLRLRAERRIKSMAEYVNDVCVYRDGAWISNISSAQLVPGDVFQIDEKSQVPCDCVLLSGAVVVNESALTGEAMPIRKIALPDDANVYDMDGSGKINTLYAGTLVSQTMPAIAEDGQHQKVCALVLRTGISSEKGMLIHKILFPSPVSFIFDEHIKVAICILLVWGLVAFCLTLYLMGRGNITSWYYGVFIMSEIFSPLLPAAFTINQSVCAARLRKKHILCIDLPRINLSGKVRIFCFDKTGTLTKEGLEFYGSVASPMLNQRTMDPMTMEPLLAMGIATCHAVTKVGDQYIGNPVDIESYHAMQWELIPTTSPDYLDSLMPPTGSRNTDNPVHVIRRCEFVHARASQSVAVLDPSNNHVHVYLKGSFERVKYLSTDNSIPDNYDTISAKHAQEGCYVLALAHRDIGELGVNVTMEQVKAMNRDDLEAGCNFIGFVLFRNMLKEDTTDAIAQLKEGDVRPVMITGDTALTGVFIARQCGMIEPEQTVLLGDLVNGQMMWHNVDTGSRVDNIDTAIHNDPRENHEKRIELALTGRAFESLTAQNKMRPYLLFTRVFARMTPNDKVQCVQLHMEKGVTAMCGDGGNDCGALRAAHVGMALSEAEASMVSPFSTSNRSVMQCVELLKQGRAALATSFSNYKFLIYYGESMAFWELIMFYFTVIACQPIWITIDGFITTTMTFAITQAQPAERLGPSRPTAKPLGAYTLASCLGVIFVNFWFMVTSVVWLFQQDWFMCNEFDSSAIDSAKWWLLGDNYEAEIISLVVLFQFFNSAAIVNFGSAFRRSWWRNYVLVVFYCCFFVHTSFLILADPNPYSCIFRVNCGSPDVLESLGYPYPWWKIEPYNSPLGHNVLPKWFRWELWGFVLGNCLINIIWERVIVLWLVRNWTIKTNKKKPKKGRVLLKL